MLSDFADVQSTGRTYASALLFAFAFNLNAAFPDIQASSALYFFHEVAATQVSYSHFDFANPARANNLF